VGSTSGGLTARRSLVVTGSLRATSSMKNRSDPSVETVAVAVTCCP